MELKPQKKKKKKKKKNSGSSWGQNDLFYSNVVKCPLKLACWFLEWCIQYGSWNTKMDKCQNGGNINTFQDFFCWLSGLTVLFSETVLL